MVTNIHMLGSGAGAYIFSHENSTDVVALDYNRQLYFNFNREQHLNNELDLFSSL